MSSSGIFLGSILYGTKLAFCRLKHCATHVHLAVKILIVGQRSEDNVGDNSRPSICEGSTTGPTNEDFF
ncbi:MAG: hypothetical protein AAB467_01240, partial [Patescibacteria group bacterium]